MVNKIIEIVREASNLMKQEDIVVEQKGNDSNYVTSADVNVKRKIVRVITRQCLYRRRR